MLSNKASLKKTKAHIQFNSFHYLRRRRRNLARGYEGRQEEKRGKQEDMEIKKLNVLKYWKKSGFFLISRKKKLCETYKRDSEHLSAML